MSVTFTLTKMFVTEEGTDYWPIGTVYGYAEDGYLYTSINPELHNMIQGEDPVVMFRDYWRVVQSDTLSVFTQSLLNAKRRSLMVPFFSKPHAFDVVTALEQFTNIAERGCVIQTTQQPDGKWDARELREGVVGIIVTGFDNEAAARIQCAINIFDSSYGW